MISNHSKPLNSVKYQRNKGSTYEPEIRVEYIPIDIERQTEILHSETSGFKEKIAVKMDLCNELPFNLASIKHLQEKLIKKNIKHFVDPQFPPMKSSLYDPILNEDYPLDYVVHWRRPFQFMSENPTIFRDEITPHGLSYGTGNRSWFVSALASLARRPELIKRMFINTKYTEFGIYRLRLYRMGEWVLVTIDDYIPCFYKGQPMFTRGRENQLWPLLIEKAYAKLLGSYEALNNGDAARALFDLTGMPILQLNFSEDISDEEEEDEDFMLQPYCNDKLQCDLEGLPKYQIFELIKERLEKGNIICARARGEPLEDTFDSEEEIDADEIEILNSHFYAILEVKETEEEDLKILVQK